MLSKSNKYLRRAKPLLGTIVEISLCSSRKGNLNLIINKCFDRIKTIQSNLSYFESTSDIFRLNRATPGESIDIMPETRSLLNLAITLYRESQGKFDVLYKGRSLNPDSMIYFYDDGSVSRNDHAEVDLGGIAKGYAVDEALLVAKEFLEEDYCDISGVINAGGDMVFFGSESFPLSIRSPKFDGRFYEAGYYSNCAVATSVFNSDDKPVSVSVTAPTCMIADSLTKALWKQDKKNRESILASYNARYMEIDSSMSMITCEGAYES